MNRFRCAQELCPHWSGDGEVCPCAVFGFDRPDNDPEDDEWWDGEQLAAQRFGSLDEAVACIRANCHEREAARRQSEGTAHTPEQQPNASDGTAERPVEAASKPCGHTHDCACGRRLPMRHLDPNYARQGFCAQPCAYCDALDASEAEGVR